MTTYFIRNNVDYAKNVSDFKNKKMNRLAFLMKIGKETIP